LRNQDQRVLFYNKILGVLIGSGTPYRLNGCGDSGKMSTPTSATFAAITFFRQTFLQVQSISKTKSFVKSGPGFTPQSYSQARFLPKPPPLYPFPKPREFSPFVPGSAGDRTKLFSGRQLIDLLFGLIFGLQLLFCFSCSAIDCISCTDTA
jgi:hypothetical protein